MFDILVNNIFILLPIAIFIGLRIVEARRRREASQQQSPGKFPGAFDDEEESRGPEPGNASWREVYTPPQPAKKPPLKQTAAASLTSKVSLRPPVTEEKKLSAATPQALKPAPSQRGKDISENLKHLSPLQRAVAFAEILGPPKGI